MNGGFLCDGQDQKVTQERSEKRYTKTRMKEVSQPHQVTIVLKLRAKKDKTITREKDILTHLIKRLDTPKIEEDDIKTEGKKRGDGRIHQIHQVQWRL